MSGVLVDGVRGGQGDPPAPQVEGSGVHLDQYIEGPLRQIEAARKALHSPSLVSRSTSARTNSSMRKYTDVAAKPGRKCLSRTQMAEPYELSQDLLDKQMEMLSSRYGGLVMANTAANTIQRAYRRYSMVKKFAAITSAAHVKTENRLSRRFQGQGCVGQGGGVVQQGVAAGHGVGQHTVRHVTHVPVQGDSVDSSIGVQYSHVSGGYHHSCCVYNKQGMTHTQPGEFLVVKGCVFVINRRKKMSWILDKLRNKVE